MADKNKENNPPYDCLFMLLECSSNLSKTKTVINDKKLPIPNPTINISLLKLILYQQ